MSRKYDPNNVRPRKLPLPPWWVESVRRLRGKWSLSEFASKLSEAAHRKPPWDRTTIGDFMRDETATLELIEAVCKLFGPELPKPVFTARTYNEARLLRHLSLGFREVEQARGAVDFELQAVEERILERVHSPDGKAGGSPFAPRSRPRRGMERSRPPTDRD
jgi:hypothetical protein